MSNIDKKYRAQGYQLLINNFEPLIRNYLINNILLPNFGAIGWIKAIPSGVVKAFEDDEKELDTNNITIFFDELYLWSLKEIILQKTIYPELKDLFGEDLSKEDFISIMDELNEHRRKIAHAKSNYTFYDFDILLELIKSLCKGKDSDELNQYIKRGGYKSDIEIPLTFFEKNKSKYIHNLPIEDYDLDGGFVGRRKEILRTKKLLYTNQDRIISITGAGGLGKTALALKCAYSILAEKENPYSNIIWFSAKEDKLTSENGIVSIQSEISDYFTILQDILKLLDYETFEVFNKNNLKEDSYQSSIYKLFQEHRILLIIDNLETITNTEIIDFIKDIPRPSQVLITSRKGLGEIERRYPLPDFLLEDAVKLFRIISRERNRIDLQKLKQKTIENYIKNVSSYPLLIKWSIGKVCLGMDINKAFQEIYEGDSEISQFVFNDIFNLLSNESKKCLYSMIIFGEKEISKHLILHLTSFSSNTIEDSIEELIITSFIYPEIKEEKGVVNTYYQMLQLTRGFIQSKLDNEKVLQKELQTKYCEMSLQIENVEKSKSEYQHSLTMFGLETEEDKIAFNHVKTAKNYIKMKDYKQARSSFQLAINISPNLSYIYEEYGRFEYIQNHIDEAEKNYLKACHCDDLNYRNHFAYGVFLRKQNRIDEAIIHLKKVEKLNPEFPSINNELGRTLCFKEEFEEANNKFEASLNQEKDYINYKHLNITLHFQSDNYKRWAEKYFNLNDIENGKKTLLKALETIKKANSNNQFDAKNLILEKRITKDVGIKLSKTGNYSLGKKYLLESANIVLCKNTEQPLTKRIASESYIFLASYSYEHNLETKETIKYYLDNAEKLSEDIRTKVRIDSVREMIFKSKIKEGTIKFFNVSKGFGVILTNEEDDSYTFVISNLKTFFRENELYYLEGKKVTFKIQNKIGKKFAEAVEVIE